jgi:AcrR family transcriptional regulator
MIKVSPGEKARSTKSAGRSAPSINSKQQEVLDVASEYFLSNGYEGASINAMARSSGISKESIYRYFGSKKELFEAVIDRELGDYQATLRGIDGTSTNLGLREALVSVAEAILRLITTDRTLALRRLIFDEATRSPDLGQHYYRIGPERAYLKLELLFESHRVDSDFEYKVLSRHFVSLISYRTMMERECRVMEEPTREHIRQLMELVVDDFLRSFLRA